MVVKVTKDCEYCGKVFCFGVRGDRAPQRFCSKWCAGQSLRIIFPKNCLICGREFVRRGKYCCSTCYGKAISQGLENHNPAKMIDYVCAYCGKEFTLKLGSGRRTYCSKECFGFGRRKPQRKKIRSRSYKAIRLRKRAHERIPCSICGFKRYVELCHVIPVIKGGNDDMDNMIYLCPNHHRLFDCHRLNKTEMRKLDDRLILLYNTGITQSQTFHYIPPKSNPSPACE